MPFFRTGVPLETPLASEKFMRSGYVDWTRLGKSPNKTISIPAIMAVAKTITPTRNWITRSLMIVLLILHLSGWPVVFLALLFSEFVETLPGFAFNELSNTRIF